MRKFERLAVMISVFFFVFAVWNTVLVAAQETKGQLSQTRYVDPKGYFKIVPPAGWKIQEYPQDPRGKVAFLNPESNIDLRVLVNAVDFSTIEELIESLKNIEKRLGITTNVERITFSGKPAVRRSFVFRGIKLYAIDFLIGKVDHNLQFGSPPNKFEKLLPIAMKSMETYEPVIKDISDKDVTKHIVAKKLRLAQLMIENGNLDLALAFVKEGLEASPRDAELLKMKKQIEDKRKK